jgi:hypothetical protein
LSLMPERDPFISRTPNNGQGRLRKYAGNSMPSNRIDSQILSRETQSVFDAYSALETDAKLALLYYVYEKMGKSITPAAPAAADPELLPMLFDQFFERSGEEQLQIMREIANGADTEYSRAYGALNPDNQLLVWYAWAREMGDTVIDIPSDYSPSQDLKGVLSQIENLDFQEQISVLREAATRMGYTSVKPLPTQAQTGKTPSL